MRKILFSLLFLFSGLVFSQTKPIAADVSAAHFKDTNGLIHLVGSDAEFHALTYTIVTLPTHGTLKDPNNSDAVISAGGSLTGNSVTFVPHSDENHKYIFSGTNSFTYKVTDSDGDSDIKTVSVEVFDAYLNPPTEIGSEINGEAPGDNFGRAVSLSEDGTIMAVGAPFNDAGSTDSDKGSVRVYQFTVGSGWSKLGDDIDGTTDQDYFGSSVSLNGDGTILAVGIPYNDTANSNAGQVKVYQYNSGTTTWDLMSTITPNIVASGSNKAVSEQFGNDVRLSSDGKTLAVSDIWFDRSGGNNSGRVVVYRYDGTSWNSLGNETALYGESGDNLSWGLSLSANGNIMAVGAHDYSSNNKGQVKIFEYDSANTEWDVKATLLGDKSAEKFGAAVDLSSDGLIVAVGAPYHRVAGSGSEFVGKVSIYKWDGSTYSALGSDLIGSDKYDYFGAHLSLDNEGNTLAVMGPGHDANSGSSSGNYLNKGRVRVYNYDTASTSWVQSPASYDFDGEEDEDQSTGSNNESKGQRVFLSGNGSVLAIGADENDGNGTNSGHVRVYELFQPQIIPVADSQDVSFLLYEQVTSDEITLKGTDSDGDDANLVYIITELNTAKLFENTTEITSSDIPHTLTANKVKYNSNSDVLVNDSFKFIVHDTKASSVPATVTLTIIPDNDPPVATGQSVTSDEDVAKDIDLAGTDVDNADTNLNFLIYSLPANGTLTDKNNGNSAVTLVTKHSGTTTSANTDKLEDSSQNFTSTVVPGDFLINTTDNTYADIKAVDSDTTLSLSADIMASGEEYTIKRGTSLVVSSGTAKVTYTPNSNYIGSDSFKFKARDKGVADDELTDVENSVDAATVSLTVNNVDNDPPVAEDQTLSTNEETETGTITLVAVDPDLDDTPKPGTPVYKDTSGSAYGVTVVGNYAYVADGDSGLAIIDVTDKANPGTPVYEDTTFANNVAVVGNYAYVPNLASGLAIIDITDKSNPGTPVYVDTGGANDVTVVGNYAYVAEAGSSPGLAIIDISDKANPGTPVYEDTSNWAVGVTVVGNYAYVVTMESGLAIIDISDPTNPGTPVYEDTTGTAYDVTVVGNYAYVADGDSGLAIIDISNKANPGTPVYKDLSKSASGVTVVGNYAYVADFESGLAIIDITDKSNLGTPVYVDTQWYARDVTVVGNYAYVADSSSGLAIIPLNMSSLTYTIASLPTSGKLKDGGTEIIAAGDISGALTYLPNANFTGNDTFKFTAKDDESTPAVSNQATVTINVGNLNDAPVATAQSVTVDEDTENDITHAGTDPDGDSLTYIIITLPSKGILKDNGTEIVTADLPKTLSSAKATYVPQTNYNGADSYTFKVNDGTVDSTLAATVDITVKEVNDPPIANSQSLTTDEDTALTIKFTGSDIENDPLTYLIKTLPTNGKLKDGNTEILASELPKLLPADEITYMPNADYIGDDSFDFLINANYLNSFTKANNLKYITQNGVPVTYQKPEGKTYFLIQENTGVSGTPIDWTTARTLTNSIKGAKMYVILDATMELLVWNGLKSMGLTGKSGLYYWIGLYQDTNSPDYAEPGLETQNWGGWTWVDGVTLKDRGYENWYNYPSEPNNAGAEHYAQFEFSSTGPKGIQWNDMSIGNAQSWPLFEFSISSNTQSAPAKISIRIESVNDPPVANAQTITTSEDVTTPAAITLTGTDPESQPLTYIVTALPNKGTLKESGTAITTADLPKTLSGNALTYSPNVDYNGNDALTFKVNDGVHESGSAIVSIVVNPVNDPPESDPQTVNTDEDVAVDITHVGRDKDLVNVFTVHTQMGADINLGNHWAEYLEISADGETMVVGGWTNNKVKVLSWDGTTWNQLGSDIDGSASGDDFGEFVSISSDGKRIAVGAHKHDSSRGEVRAFDWDGTSWTQVGAAMEGGSTGDNLGRRGVHISGDGNVIAAAAFAKGYVDTYKWDGTSWNKTANISVTAGGGDAPGQVSLSNNGNRLAIGTANYSGSKGQVKIFDWDGTNTWNQYAAIDGKNGGDKFGGTLSISRDGKKLSVGVNGAGSARVYDLSGTNANQVGSDINYGSNAAWRAISLSDDGNRLAIPQYGTKTGVFDWDGTSWKQLGEDLVATSDEGESLDMSADGKVLAIGGHSGLIKVFNILNLTYIITSLPSNGILKEGTKTITASDLPFTLKGTDATYVPNTGFSGEDKYNFKVNDGKLDSTNSLNGKREDSQVTIKIKEFVLNLPLSNYTITPTETCKGFAFGIIDIEVAATSYKKTAAGADIPITYNIAIEGKGQVATIVSPAKTAQIKDLAEGTHKLVFTVVGQPKYEQKIDVQIIGTDPPVAYTVGKIENCDDDADGDDTNGKVNFDTSSILDKLLKNPSTGALQDKNLFDFEFTYYDDATSGNVTKATLPNPLYSASQTVSVKFKSKINGKCEANQTIDFVVNALPEIKRIEDTKSVCTNLPPATIGVTNADNRKYTYTWTRNGTNFPLNITGIDSSILIGLGGEYIVTATTTDGTNCSKSMKITIKESSIATLLRTDIVIKDLLAGPNNTITIKTATLGIGDYEYALDDQTGPYQDEPVFNKVRPGKHTVYVRDKNGCGVVNMDVWVIGYKKFFTPNGDGYTDKWNIIGITKDYQARSKIYIFDRFEKLLKELDPLTPGWDGNFNGKPMPQTDYWFKVILEDGRMFKGHFSLIRAW